MRGQNVVCKDVTGDMLVRIAWGTENGLVFIHSTEEWTKRMAGEPHLDPVGFPTQDVFPYNQNESQTKAPIRGG
jgi:hypothetical protein